LVVREKCRFHLYLRMAYWLSAKDVIANNLLGEARKQGSSAGLDLKEKRNVGVRGL